MISCSHWGMFKTDFPYVEIGYRLIDGVLTYYREEQSGLL